MVWSQFSIKILGVHFGSSVLDNSNWDKISHSLAKENQYLEQSATHFEMKKQKKNCKSNFLIQTLMYRSNIYYSKIYHKGAWKNNSSTTYLVMWHGIIQKKSASGSRTLPCLVILFQSPILMPKTFLKYRYLGTSTCYLRNKVPFFVFRKFSYDLDYSLCGLGILDIDTQLKFLEIKWIYKLLNPANALWKGSHQCSQGSQNLFSDPSLLVQV